MFGSVSSCSILQAPLPYHARSCCSSTNCLIHDEHTWLPGSPSIMQHPASNFRTRRKGIFFLPPTLAAVIFCLDRENVALQQTHFGSVCPGRRQRTSSTEVTQRLNVDVICISLSPCGQINLEQTELLRKKHFS